MSSSQMGKRSQYIEIRDETASSTSETQPTTTPTNPITNILPFLHRRAAIVLGAIGLVTFALLLPHIQSTNHSSTGTSPDSSSSTTTPSKDCIWHQSSSLSSLRIIQTSLTAPSRQWETLPCTPVTNQIQKEPQRARMHMGALSDRPAPPLEILGFGGAFTEATALNFHSLNGEARQAALRLLFSREGLGYSLGRVHMNSCDFCEASYNFAEVDGDFDLEYFDNNVTHDVESGLIPFALEASSMVTKEWPEMKEGLRILASPWSPPPWMKDPTPADPPGATHAEAMIGSHTPSCLREGTTSEYAKSWALFFTKFITAYKKHQVPLWAVTVQNEPEFPAPWDACAYTADSEANFIKTHLRPLLTATHPEILLFAFDHNKDHAPHWSDVVRGTTGNDTDGVAVHWYAGGMDRLLDGAVGMPNMHRLIRREQSGAGEGGWGGLVIGSEGCHCPSTAYAGGDILVAWDRAERYAHAIMADLNAGSNGWIDWNMILDSIGGPNHVGNVCDAPILAVPHRALNASGDNISPQMPFEHGGYPFGTPVGDSRTKEDLDAAGFPKEYLDLGLAVQPAYFYIGHITKYVRPGSRVANSHVEGHGIFQGGGGDNNLARIGVEVTVWPCETSTRQVWKYNDKHQLQVFGHDWLHNPTTSCLGSQPDSSFGGLLLTSCEEKDAQAGHFHFQNGRFQIQNDSGTEGKKKKCLVVKELENDGGAAGVRSGSQVTVGDCKGKAALWRFNEKTGEVSSGYFDKMVCMTTGWPFLQIATFNTPTSTEGNKTMIILNEAFEAAKYEIVNDKSGELLLRNEIPSHSIQTVIFD